MFAAVASVPASWENWSSDEAALSALPIRLDPICDSWFAPERPADPA